VGLVGLLGKPSLVGLGLAYQPPSLAKPSAHLLPIPQQQRKQHLLFISFHIFLDIFIQIRIKTNAKGAECKKRGKQLFYTKGNNKKQNTTVAFKVRV